jgi:hypothetical protein
MGKGRERQIILKTDQRDILLKMGLGGKFQTRSSGWDENRIFFEGDIREAEVCNGTLGANPRSGRAARGTPSAQHYFPTESDGVTGYVTSSHGAATPLRDGVPGHLAGNRPVDQRTVLLERGLGGEFQAKSSG